MIIKAERVDKGRVVALLCLSFSENLSVGYLVGTGKGRRLRLRRLMAYAFEVCFRFGEVWLSEGKQGCALVLYPHLKGFSLRVFWMDLNLVFGVVGLLRLSQVLRREKLLAARHRDNPFYYLWFIGVNPWVQRQGIGTLMLREFIADAELAGMPVYLETSVVSNLVWYEKFGFRVYDELDFGYRLFFLKKVLAGSAIMFYFLLRMTTISCLCMYLILKCTY
ncbi:MAG: GNAT family N-acetyltransferase [Candidatus Pedobacter colombiensis]|uniref:GNAT family N-acetyltransferase n=1 Tax=Candidatus Pedobacter colombiensis TaxID=3121371 RepID=A0AAJ5W9C4_9SPHI|nr:GNAT family N-acetyltransferase [Pedobacter sp.]WEK20422.1 MAG: GNAT family N-acetyltransferase [Pedobacter sp.]